MLWQEENRRQSKIKKMGQTKPSTWFVAIFFIIPSRATRRVCEKMCSQTHFGPNLYTVKNTIKT
jgi:hypothetical protein